MNSRIKMCIVLATAVISGCSSIGKFKCPPAEGLSCMSAKEVYMATSNGGSVHDSNDSHKSMSGSQTYNPRIDAPYVNISANRPVPIRTPTLTMRIYISSYEDERTEMLIAPHYIFSDVEARNWVIGDENVTQTRKIGTPLEENIQ